MTHFLSALFFLVVLAGSFGTVWTMLRDNRDAILSALAAATPSQPKRATTVNFVNFRGSVRSVVTMPRLRRTLRAAA